MTRQSFALRVRPATFRRALMTSVAVLGAASLAACGGGSDGPTAPPPPPPPASVASVSLASTQTSLLAFVADSVHLGTAAVTATVRDASGNVLTGHTVTWASSDTNVVQVSSSGVVQAIAGGAATVTATSDGVSGTIGFTVTNPAVAHISVSPAYDTVHVGQTATLDVRVYDANMNEIITYSHHRTYGVLIVPSITQASDVISPDAQNGNVFHADNPGDAVVTFKTSGIGINAKITVLP